MCVPWEKHIRALSFISFSPFFLSFFLLCGLMNSFLSFFLSHFKSLSALEACFIDYWTVVDVPLSLRKQVVRPHVCLLKLFFSLSLYFLSLSLCKGKRHPCRSFFEKWNPIGIHISDFITCRYMKWLCPVGDFIQCMYKMLLRDQKSFLCSSFLFPFSPKKSLFFQMVFLLIIRCPRLVFKCEVYL